MAIRKIFLIFVFFAFLLLNTQSEAKEKEYKPGVWLLVKNTPILALDFVRTIPLAIMPGFNYWFAVEGVGGHLAPRELEQKRTLLKELQAQKLKNEPIENKETFEVLVFPEKAEKDQAISLLEEKKYSYDEIAKITDNYSGPQLILNCKNELSNKEFFNKIFDDEELLKKVQKDISKGNCSVVSEGFLDGNYLKYLSLYDYKLAFDIKVDAKEDYNFIDNYNTFLLLNQNGYSNEDIKKIINQKNIKKEFFPIITGKDFYQEYRFKEAKTKKVLNNSKISKDKKIEKIIKATKTKTEKTANIPLVHPVTTTLDYALVVPYAVGWGFGSFLIYAPTKIYANTTKDWYSDVKNMKYINEEIKKEMKYDEENKD